MNAFEANAAELEKLNERVRETVRHRSEGPEGMAAWERATAAFHASYDTLAFPGGLAREFERLERGEPEAIELALQFLEANPWYFRSGYHKADVLKLLKKHPLKDDQCVRLRKVILDRVRGRPIREIRAYGRIAAKVSDAQFEAELTCLAEEAKRPVARQARCVLESMRSTRRSSR